MRCRMTLLLAVLVLVAVPIPSLLAAPPTAGELDADRQTLLDAGLASDGVALVQFFRGRSRLDFDREDLQVLARQLGDTAVEVRSRAAVQLIACGPAAVQVLRQTINDLDNAEAAGAARRCLLWIDGKMAAQLPAAAARLVAVRQPEGAVEVLLAYLPLADDASVVEEVAAALRALAVVQGKVNPAIQAALHDPVPLRRAVAAEALARSDQPEQLPAVRALLRDAKPLVRLRAALALVHQQDVDSIPVLIDLLAELAASDRQQAEDALQQLAGEWAPTLTLRGEDDISRRIRRDAWAAWWRNTDGPALVDEFRKHTLRPAERDKVMALVHKLADDLFVVREQASADLVAYGPAAVPLLRQAAKSKDPEQARRADDCLRRITRDEGRQLAMASPRLLALRRPAGAVEVLLDYAPFAENDAMLVELQSALAALAMRDGKPESALVHALDDPLPLRRALAGAALSHTGPEERPALRKLLKDNDPLVRGRVARALALVGEREAVPVLIELLTGAPEGHSEMAQEILYSLAGDKAPSPPAADDKAGPQKWRDAWNAWWRDQGKEADLSQLAATRRLLGYTLIAEFDGNGNGRVSELSRDGKPRWWIDNLQYPIDARVLDGRRVLIAEYGANRVTERDFKGAIVWKTDNLPGQPINAQRLANGNTFIVLLNSQILEVDRAGKILFSKPVPGLNAACKLPNGNIVCLTTNGMCIRFDATGKELKTFAMGFSVPGLGAIEVLPNNHVLLCNGSHVIEFDVEGKRVWETAAPQSTAAVRLANGNTLYASQNGQKMVEIDRSGKTVWEHKTTWGAYRVRRR